MTTNVQTFALATFLAATTGTALATGYGQGGGKYEFNNTNNNYNKNINGSYNTKHVYDNSTHTKYETKKYTTNNKYDNSQHYKDDSIHNTAKGGSVGNTTATGGNAKQDQNQTLNGGDQTANLTGGDQAQTLSGNNSSGAGQTTHLSNIGNNSSKFQSAALGLDSTGPTQFEKCMKGDGYKFWLNATFFGGAGLSNEAGKWDKDCDGFYTEQARLDRVQELIVLEKNHGHEQRLAFINVASQLALVKDDASLLGVETLYQATKDKRYAAALEVAAECQAKHLGDYKQAHDGARHRHETRQSFGDMLAHLSGKGGTFATAGCATKKLNEIIKGMQAIPGKGQYDYLPGQEVYAAPKNTPALHQ